MDFDMKMLAYCGLYCEQCSARVAFLEQDISHAEAMPSQFQPRPNLSDYDCECCKGRSICGPCEIRDCAAAREVASCADCSGFPCSVVDAFANDGYPHHRQAWENLKAIRENGAEDWFKSIKPALRCHCGKRQSWYRACPEHGY